MPDLGEIKTQLEQPNVAAEAVFKTGIVSEGAQRLKAKKAEKGPKEFLDAYNMNKPFEKGAGDEAAEKMGIERNAAGAKSRTGAEATRYSNAKAEIDLIEEYLEKGPDSIRPNSTQEQKIIAYFDRAIVLWPEAASMTQADREAYIRKKLKDPRFIARVKEAYDGAIKKAESFDESVTNKEAEFKEAERKRAEKDREKAKITREKADSAADIALYSKDAQGNPTGKLLILNNAQRDAVQAKHQIELIDDQIAQKRADMAAKEAERAQYQRNSQDWNQAYSEMLRLKGEITTLEGQKVPESRKIANAELLQKEYDELKAKHAKNEDEEFRVEGELDEAKYKEAAARAIYEDAKATRTGQETQFVDGLQRVFYNAALEDISATIKEHEEYRREELEKIKGQIGDQASKTVIEGIKDRWTNVIKDGSGKIKKIELQKGKIQQDYYTLLSEGPQGMLRQMLADAKDSGGNSIFTDAEIAVKLNDPEFVGAAESEFIATLLRKRLQTSKITEGEANLLFDRFGDKVIDTALSKNDEATGVIDKLKEKHGFKGSRQEFFKSMMKNPKTYGGLAAILALLLGSPFLLAGGIAATGAYTSAAGAAL